MTQQDLAHASSISVRQIQRIEQGKQSPSIDMVRSIGDALDLAGAHAQHLERLFLPPAASKSIEVDDVNRQIISAIAPHLGAAVDWNWNILVANKPYQAAFPGIMEYSNVLLWFLFDERSKEVMVEWEEEAALTILWWKHSTVLWGETPESRELFKKCRHSQFFLSVWDRPMVEGERTKPVMLLNGPEGVESITACLYSRPVADGKLFYLGVRL